MNLSLWLPPSMLFFGLVACLISGLVAYPRLIFLEKNVRDERAIMNQIKDRNAEQALEVANLSMQVILLKERLATSNASLLDASNGVHHLVTDDKTLSHQIEIVRISQERDNLNDQLHETQAQLSAEIAEARNVVTKLGLMHEQDIQALRGHDNAELITVLAARTRKCLELDLLLQKQKDLVDEITLKMSRQEKELVENKKTIDYLHGVLQGGQPSEDWIVRTTDEQTK